MTTVIRPRWRILRHRQPENDEGWEKVDITNW